MKPSKLYSVQDRVDVWEDYGRMCHYCDRKLPKPGTKSGRATHFDHIIPVTKGGSHSKKNLVICCKRCNTEKGNKDYLEFLEYRLHHAKKQVHRLAKLIRSHKLHGRKT